MKNLSLLAILLLTSFAAQAQTKQKIYCVFQNNLADSGSGYLQQYTVKGYFVAGATRSENQIRVSVKRSEFGAQKSGTHSWKPDFSHVKNENLTDVPVRTFAVSAKNNNPSWITYVPKVGYGDGNTTNWAITIGTETVSDPAYGNSFKAILQYTLLGDDTNATSKAYGNCSIEKAAL